MTENDWEIREITGGGDLEEVAQVIRDSFATVAAEFNLTAKNCPTHSSFTTAQVLTEMIRCGLRAFGLFRGDDVAGFVAMEDKGDGVFWVEKLAVLPKFRHIGLGSMLMEHVVSEARKARGKTVTLALVNDHVVLKRWYEDQGFIVTHTERYEHLPFIVCFME